MSKKTPKVPPESRSRKGTGSNPKMHDEEVDTERENLAEQGQQANIRQNTRNQGYQQDR